MVSKHEALQLQNGKKETINPYDKEVTTHNMTQIDHSIVNFQNHITTIKPDKYNFLVCKRKIIKILYSLDLEQYLTSVGPPIILQNGEVNPSYKIQDKQDLMIENWFMHCIKQDVVHHIFGFKNMREIWSGQDNYFMSK